MFYNILNYLKILKETTMRIALTGIVVGVATAVSLRREKELQVQTITLSLFSEVMTIVSLGILELS